MTVLHPAYLPFSAEQLRTHFAPVGGGGGNPDLHLAYYRLSARRYLDYKKNMPAGPPLAVAKYIRFARQIEKDERFWIVTLLLRAYYSADRRPALRTLLSMALGATPPFPGCATWDEALGEQPVIYFEVNLPSPPSYRAWLRGRLEQQILVPYILEAASTKKERLEGATKADAMIIAPDTGFAAIFEAKVLSDTSTQTSYDSTRNQIARSIDVLLDSNPQLRGGLERRDPQRSCFVLVTPRLFHANPSSRLYGWLMRDYRTGTELLARHLPHRIGQLDGVPQRLGWITWEDCNDAIPNGCPWLPS
jgi:hypothetical protein